MVSVLSVLSAALVPAVFTSDRTSFVVLLLMISLLCYGWIVMLFGFVTPSVKQWRWYWHLMAVVLLTDAIAILAARWWR